MIKNLFVRLGTRKHIRFGRYFADKIEFSNLYCKSSYKYIQANDNFRTKMDESEKRSKLDKYVHCAQRILFITTLQHKSNYETGGSLEGSSSMFQTFDQSENSVETVLCT